jgi:CTP-dependent riboflavin kinase
VDKPTKLNGVIFSDMGRASSFMAVEWVQRVLEQSLGFVPYPATLNLRPNDLEDLRRWETLRKETRGIVLTPEHAGFCRAQLFPVEIQRTSNGRAKRARGAILLPDVSGYPEDKIEVVAPIRLKDEFGVRDGDQLTLEFLI